MAGKTSMMKMCVFLFGFVACYVLLSEVHLTRECFKFCNSDSSQDCYLRRTAVLVYDQNVSSHEMSFSQNTHPSINLGSYAMEVLSGRYFDINCPVDHYWPRVSTLSRRNDCAVVGNSGILNGANCGRTIDKHEFIIRANMAPIQGYEADVGTRANLTVLNFETLFYMHKNLTLTHPDDKWHRTYVDRATYLNDSVLWYSKSTLQRNSSIYLRNVAHVLQDLYRLPIRLAYSWRSVSVEKFYGLTHFATTGFNAYVIAKTFCNHVTLYGFHPSNQDELGNHVAHHYYEDVEYEYNNDVHNIRSEFRKLQELETKGEVTIVTDVCPGGARKKTFSNINKEELFDPKFLFMPEANKLKKLFDVENEGEENDEKLHDDAADMAGPGRENRAGEKPRIDSQSKMATASPGLIGNGGKTSDTASKQVAFSNLKPVTAEINKGLDANDGGKSKTASVAEAKDDLIMGNANLLRNGQSTKEIALGGLNDDGDNRVSGGQKDETVPWRKTEAHPQSGFPEEGDDPGDDVFAQLEQWNLGLDSAASDTRTDTRSKGEKTSGHADRSLEYGQTGSIGARDSDHNVNMAGSPVRTNYRTDYGRSNGNMLELDEGSPHT
ncbi:uncharacterized protein [Diadema setosum]|uniref:uncharacterized protein n=1 Tax=Diadema setosum TaxID=31175 RepID=UPI003B39FAC2